MRMQTQMSTLDLKGAVSECQSLRRGRIGKVFAGSKTIALGIHVVGTGKVWLVASLPGFFYATKEKPRLDSISPFQSALKKYMEGCRLEKVEQLGYERAVKIECNSKEGCVWLVVELFGSGNAVLGLNDKNMMILNIEECKRNQKGKPYSPPDSKCSLWEISEPGLHTLLSNSSEPISAVLATNGLGAMWAKEVCARASQNPKQPAPTVNSRLVWAEIQMLKRQPIDPCVVYQDGKVIDVKPFPMKIYESFRQEKSLFGEGIAKELVNRFVKTSKWAGKLAKIKRILDTQKEYESTLMNDIGENIHKGEHIFEKYQLVQKILEEVKEARKRLSWKEIKARLKDHPIIKGINEAKGEIEIEI